MPTEKKKVTRKLSAILSADVQGYSLLMADDEVYTIETLKAYRHKISELVSKHSGRVVDSPGDNVLAEFRSSVDAVECAVKIQKALDKENSKYVDDKKVQFRIGVNIGDVIQDGDRIYGNGVNVAARIEGLADPGGVCISRNVYNHVGNKLSLGYEYLGEHTVKNIKKPVRAYKLLMADEDAGKLIGDVPKSVAKKWIYATAVLAIIVITAVVWQAYQKMAEPEFEPAKVEEMAYPLPENPSIAVLAFDNMTGDPAQDYIGDGIAEAIITALSRIDELFVVARNSSFYFKGKSVKIKEISEELGVRYVMEGSVVNSGGKVRITAQLIDAVKGRHIWAKNYDHDFGNIIKIHDDISLNIAQNLRIELTEGEQERVFFDDYKNPEVFYKWAEANSQLRKGGEGSLERMGQLAQEVLDIEPESLIGYWMKGWYHKFLAENGISKKENVKKGFEYASKALSLNENDSFTHSLMCGLYFIIRDYEKSIVSGNRAVELQPGADTAHMLLGKTLLYAEQYDEAIYHLKKSIRLNPFPAYFNFQYLGMCYYHKGQYKEALIELKKADKLSPDDSRILFYLAIVYSSLDREEEAQSSAKKALELGPYLSVSFVSKIWGYKTKDRLPKFLNAMRKAGFPEYPPGKEPPAKPSIAVLPFDNLSDDPEQEYFSDGMTDELIADLAKIDGIFVISRNSTFTYKGKAVKIQQVAQELNVRYVLEGSVQRSGNKVRIRAQLIDGNTDHHIWSESYDGVMDDIFELQDEITGKIVAALAVKLTEDEKEKISEKGTDNISAYDAYLKGHALYAKYTPESIFKSLDYYKQAIEIDPDFSRAYAGLALSYWQLSSYRLGSSLDLKQFERTTFRFKSRQYLNTAMKNPTWEGYRLLAYLELNLRHYDDAIYAAEKAYSLAPNEDLTNIALGIVLISIGKPQEAIIYLEQSIELAPQYLDIKMTKIGEAHFLMGNYKEAISNHEQAISINPDMPHYNIILAASYALSGRKKEAIKTFQIYKDKAPERVYSSEALYYGINYIDHENFERLLKGLRVAGFDEDPLEYFKVEIENRLGGDEIENLFKGNILTLKSGEVFYCYKDGQLGVHPFGEGGPVFNGKWWVDNDMGCIQAVNLYDGTEICSDFYRTPEKVKKKYDYLLYHDDYISPFTIQELE